MGWQEERGRLLADTLAVVQSLGRKADAQAPRRVPVTHASERRRPNEPDPWHEMNARLEAFRNRQRFLQIEREVYLAQAMQRLLAVTERRA
jgi:hypothetical protein